MKSLTDKNNNKIDIIYFADLTISELVGCNKRLSVSYDTADQKTVVTDHLTTGNQVTTYKYQTLDNLSWITSMSGNCCGYNMSYEYDDQGNQVKMTDANGQVYTYTYDANGNILTATDPLNQVSTYTYTTSFNKVNSYKDPKGNLYSMSYDTDGNMTQLITPGNNIHTAVYNASGDIINSTAWRVLQFKPDMDVALLNAMIYTIVEENLVDPEFIRTRTTGFEALKENAKGFSPEAMAPLCGIPAETIREVARAYATSKGSMILWGMGISQHVHGTDNARCHIALTLMTGQIGRPGTGLHPLRGQNNVQGASDSGLIPMMFPDYQRVDNPEANKRFSAFWNTTLDTKPDLTVVEVMNAAKAGTIRGMYVMGENAAMSDPDATHAREAMAHLDHLVVQDIFLTETAYLADVVLPATAWPEKDGTVLRWYNQGLKGIAKA